MRRWWAGGLVLIGCWKDNPGFLGEPLETSSSGAAASSSGSGSSTGTSTTGTQDGTSETTGPIEPGTSTTSTSTTTASTGATSGPDGSSTGEPLSEQERCDMAAAADLAGVYPLLCGKPYAAWSFGPSVDSPTMPTTCPIESSEVGVVNKLPQATTEAGEVFAPALLLGPRAGKPGLIQGAFTGLDLSQMKLPCLATRIDYSAESGWALLKVQVVAHDVELDQTAELFVTDVPLPHQTPVDLVIPLVGSLAEGKVDVALVVHREGQEGTEIPALLWDNPRILDAGP